MKETRFAVKYEKSFTTFHDIARTSDWFGR